MSAYDLHASATQELLAHLRISFAEPSIRTSSVNTREERQEGSRAPPWAAPTTIKRRAGFSFSLKGGKQVMKVFSVISLLFAAAILATIPISPQVTPRGLELRVDEAGAVTYGRYRRVHRRVYRRAYRSAYYSGAPSYYYGAPSYYYGARSYYGAPSYYYGAPSYYGGPGFYFGFGRRWY
jgi:hypothetical protein